ncbi:MAG: RimK family alpha-L-glutamate ligase [Candidatus Eisenbacteria bacterium]|nr:RimK family alpha-L-glutamate ligase [Candidatus Eisenbacteria bacterium]
MPNRLVVVDRIADWTEDYPDVRVVEAGTYLAGEEGTDRRDLKVVNLCSSYRYLSVGYYCSLLAEARRQRVIPTVRKINDIASRSIYMLELGDVDDLLQRSLGRSANGEESELELDIFFGRCARPEMSELARQLFEVFRIPLLRVRFKLQGRWRIAGARPLSLSGLDDDSRQLFCRAFAHYSSRRWRGDRAPRTYRYDIAILRNPNEELPPSYSDALDIFVRVGRKMGVNVELIEKRDYARLTEYDALFIRETTAINDHTYRFAKRAEIEGMPVIDSPDSILRCTNKVYLAELLRTRRVPTPRTLVLRSDGVGGIERELPFPVVLKIPDGSSSRGVFRVDDRAELEAKAAELFRHSDLILAQEYTYTPFDWRVGVLNARPLFVCKYFMSDDHWQIIRHEEGQITEGGWETLAVEDAPERIVELGLDAARLIGDGLYGVDIKEVDGRAMVIEVNENPNIETDVEDAVLGERLYEAIINELIRRVDARRA